MKGSQEKYKIGKRGRRRGWRVKGVKGQSQGKKWEVYECEGEEGGERRDKGSE